MAKNEIDIAPPAAVHDAPSQADRPPEATLETVKTQAEYVVPQLVCKACGHKWHPRQSGRPTRCPHCSSSTWDTGRKRPPLREMRAAKAARQKTKAETISKKGAP